MAAVHELTPVLGAGAACRALGLPRGQSAEATEKLIDAAQDRRGLGGPRFSAVAAHLRSARKPHDLTRRAAVVHQIEKDLT